MSATACTAIASPAPVGIHAFVGLALDAHLRHVARRAPRPGSRASRRRTASSFGRSAITTTSTLVTIAAGRAHERAGALRSSFTLSAPFHAGRYRESGGRCRRAPAAPSTASVTAWHTTSASEWPGKPLLERNGHAAEHRAAGPPPGGAGRSRCRSGCRCGAASLEQPFGQRQVGRRRDLHVARDRPRRAAREARRARRASPRRWRRTPLDQARRAARPTRNACGVWAR